MPAHWTVALKLPKRRRIVVPDGLIPACVHDAAVGKMPRSATKRRTASSAWSEARLPFNLTGGAVHRIQRCSSCVWRGFRPSGPPPLSSGLHRLITNRRHHLFQIRRRRSRPSSVHYRAGGTTAHFDPGPVGVRLSRLGLGNCTTQPRWPDERFDAGATRGKCPQ
jgi:hypothetical protein